MSSDACEILYLLIEFRTKSMFEDFPKVKMFFQRVEYKKMIFTPTFATCLAFLSLRHSNQLNYNQYVRG